MNYIFTHYTTSKGQHNFGVNVLLNSIKVLNDNTIKVILFYDGYKDFNEYRDFVTVVNINNAGGWIPEMRVNVQRWYLYRNYIEKNIYKFNKQDKFFHCDSADVIFQKNIFNEIKEEEKILFFTENSECDFTEKPHKKWINHLHNFNWEGIQIQNIIKNKIICSGTIYFSNLSLFIDFLSRYAAYELNCMINNDLFNENPYNKMGGVNDQGVVNSLVYNFPDSTYKIIENETLNLVCTMALMKRVENRCNESQYEFKTSSNIISVNNIIPCVLHQYNRYDEGNATLYNRPNLTKFIYNKYIGT